MYWLSILINLVKNVLWTLNTESQRALLIFRKIKARKENNECAGQKHLFPQLDQYGKVRACCCQGFCCLSGLGTARLLWRLGIVTVCLCQSLHSKVTVSLYFILISHPDVCCVCTLHLTPSQGLSRVKSWVVMKWSLLLDHLHTMKPFNRLFGVWNCRNIGLFLQCFYDTPNIFTLSAIFHPVIYIILFLFYFFNVKHFFFFLLPDFLLQIWKILEIFSEKQGLTC